MRLPYRHSCLAAVGMFAFALPAAAEASVIDPRELSMAVQSSLVDFDTMMISTHFGSPNNQSLAYTSTISRNAWNGHLFGDVGGNSVDILYTGTMTPLDPDGLDYSLAYSSEWMINGDPGTGSGTGTSIDPLGFATITISHAGATGTITYNSGAVSITITVMKDFDAKKFSAEGTIGVFTVPVINTSLVDGSLRFDYDQVTGGFESKLRARFIGIPLWRRTINEGTITTEDPPTEYDGLLVPSVCGGEWCNPDMSVPVLPGSSTSSITVDNVPEPASWALMIAGFGLVGAALRRARRSAPAILPA